MTAANQFDVAVIGLGAMGAHAIQQLAARGLRVIGIERFGPLHDRGSSHGDSRLIRLGYFEDPAYVPLLRRAYHNWRALEHDRAELNQMWIRKSVLL
jgi:sarcosine oxidase